MCFFSSEPNSNIAITNFRRNDSAIHLCSFETSECAFAGPNHFRIKSFFNYLVFEDYRSDNPLELIETPKTGRKLPDTLAIEEIDALINAIDLTSNEGERNRAILETLYGCGLRVSELVSLKISDLFFEEGFVKITGKGNKQRFVPIGHLTQKYIQLYKENVRSHVPVKKGFEDTLFLNRRGSQLTRAMIFTHY